jgi:hypothetical protein
MGIQTRHFLPLKIKSKKLPPQDRTDDPEKGRGLEKNSKRKLTQKYRKNFYLGLEIKTN